MQNFRQKRRFYRYITALSEIKSPNFTIFIFLDNWHKNCIKIGESCGIERIAARSETALKSGFRELQKHLEV